MEMVKFLAVHWMDILVGIQGMVAASLVVAMIIPGDQPDKGLQACLDFLKKFSVKKPPVE
jgi:hypothetical protein